MVNMHLLNRLSAMQQSLMAAHAGTAGIANAAKGAGRADFVSKFLSETVPPAYRIRQSAVITDAGGSMSGEVDIVLENGFSPSFHLPNSDAARLHLAEGVGVVVEVKSNLMSQWPQALETARKVKALDRVFSGGTFGTHGTMALTVLPFTFDDPNLPKLPPDSHHHAMTKRVPFFLVGYEGWSTQESISEKLIESDGAIDGILQIDKGFFVSGGAFQGIRAHGALGLFALIMQIGRTINYTQHATFDMFRYVT
jgi:hypothetical protein